MKNQINKITIGLIFCSLFSLTNAQQSNIQLDEVQSRMLVINDGNSKAKTNGSPYVNENFTPIRITQFKDKIYSARYNAFINEMEVTLENAKVIALNPNSDYVVTFTTTNKVYKAVNYVDDNEVSKKGFLVLLSENEKCSLFKEERIKFYEKTVATTSYDKEIAAKYKRVDDNYYIKLGDKTTFLPQRKKDFLKLFPNEEKKLSTYMKKNKLNPKNEDELISVIKYLSTLIE